MTQEQFTKAKEFNNLIRYWGEAKELAENVIKHPAYFHLAFTEEGRLNHINTDANNILIKEVATMLKSLAEDKISEYTNAFNNL